MTDEWHVTLAAFERGLAQGGGLSWQGLAHGTMRTLLFSPGGRDLEQVQKLVQTEHEQDEIYIILRGSCLFSRAGAYRSLEAGDVVLVPAGETHNFHGFSDDFAAWVIFWGPPGGES